MTDYVEERRAFEEEMARIKATQDGSHSIPHTAFFVGGKYHGIYVTHDKLMEMGNGQFTFRWSMMEKHNPLLINLHLEDQPLVDGYLSPMWDGGYLRYETQEVYDMMFD